MLGGFGRQDLSFPPRLFFRDAPVCWGLPVEGIVPCRSRTPCSPHAPSLFCRLQGGAGCWCLLRPEPCFLGLLTASMSVFPRKGFGVLHTRYTDDPALGVSKLTGALCFQKWLPSVEEGGRGLK